MGERTNGYITIVAGMPEASGPPPDSRASAGRKRELAHRLRKQGWSYRRISGALDVPYPQVLNWMDDSPAHTGPVRLSGLATGPRPAAKPAAANEHHSHAAISRDEVLERLEELAAAQREQTLAIALLERRLVAAVEAEAKSWGQRILNAIKTLKGKTKPDTST